LSLVLVDLDDFKSVNERDGHAAGDKLLRKVGATLARSTRAEELCARIGGDEFAVVISGKLAEADSTAHRVQQALAREGVSASVATGELKPGEQLRELYRRVDFALKAKKEERYSARHPASVQRDDTEAWMTTGWRQGGRR
jgi:diguanylate cyclase (GGDEF)-like protein